MVQALTGITGLAVFAIYMMATYTSHPPASVGFEGYIYPDERVCEMYSGVPGTNPNNCVYNAALWGTDGVDNGAWPTGDAVIHSDSLHQFDGLAPFPNAVFYNWATIVILVSAG